MIHDVCLSVPCIVSDMGVSKIIESPLLEEELASLSRSAQILREANNSIC